MKKGSSKSELSEELLAKFQHALLDDKLRAEMMEELTPAEMRLFKTWKRTEALVEPAAPEPMRDEIVEASARTIQQALNDLNEDSRTPKLIKPRKK